MSIAQGLLGRSVYEREPRIGTDIESRQVVELRRELGGQLQPLPYSQMRWYPADVEIAQHAADTGNIQMASRIWQAAQSDGVFRGLLSTRTGGLVRLPRQFRGDPDIIQELEAGSDSVRSVFDEMFPATELAKLAADGVGLGAGVAELLPVQGRAYPVMVRLDPQWLKYQWNENRWYYRSIAGLLPIYPGDGRWVLHTPGGRTSPWNGGIWQAIARAFIRKYGADFQAAAWEGKLANPARVAVSPSGASEPQKQAWFQAVMAWGINTVFGTPPGYDVKLLESNGRGYESFLKTIERSEREMILAVAGQEVTTTGGTGFANADIHQSIRTDLLKETADGLVYTINTQGIPIYVELTRGAEAAERSPVLSYDITPPKDHESQARATTTVSGAIKSLGEALKPYGLKPDVQAIVDKYNVPVLEIEKDSESDHIELTPSAKESIYRVDEARESDGFDPIGDERGDMTISELREAAKADEQDPPTQDTAGGDDEPGF